MSDYKISDKDIEAVSRYMKAVYPDKPEKAESVYCLAFLEYIHSRVKKNIRDIALNNPDQLEKLSDEFDEFLEQQSKETK